jgi:outer membrane murein-binding lipoprotein Lpp
MVKKILATAVLSGALTFGVAGVAGAASTTTGTYPSCAKAPKALAHIDKLEAKGNTWLAKAAQRETAANQAGRTKAAARIERRIQRVEKLEAKGARLSSKIEAACPGATAATSTAPPSS